MLFELRLGINPTGHRGSVLGVGCVPCSVVLGRSVVPGAWLLSLEAWRLVSRLSSSRLLGWAALSVRQAGQVDDVAGTPTGACWLTVRARVGYVRSQPASPT